MKKLNLGCGHRRIDGYLGVDAVARPEADIVAPAHAIPLGDGEVDEIMAIHLVEHIDHWLLPDALKEWHRLMAPGGRLVLEMPDLLKCCRNILDGVQGKHPDSLGLFGLYGDYRLRDPFMMHKFAYTFATLKPLVEAAGFVDVVEKSTEFHRVGRLRRDFRLEARKA